MLMLLAYPESLLERGSLIEMFGQAILSILSKCIALNRKQREIFTRSTI